MTLQQPARVNRIDLKKAVLLELKRIDEERHLYDSILKKLGGINEVREETITKRTNKTRKPRHVGAPAELYDLLKPTIGSEFTVDKAMEVVKAVGADYNRVGCMNAIQSLLKSGKVKIVHSGRGRACAVYALKTPRKNTAAIEKATNTE